MKICHLNIAISKKLNYKQKKFVLVECVLKQSKGVQKSFECLWLFRNYVSQAGAIWSLLEFFNLAIKPLLFFSFCRESMENLRRISLDFSLESGAINFHGGPWVVVG